MEKHEYRRNPQLQVRVCIGWQEDYWPYTTPADCQVYSCIASYAHWTSGEARPTFKTIHLDTGISFDTIRDSVRWLETIGVMSVKFRKAVSEEGREYGRKRHFYTLKHRPNKSYARGSNKVSREAVKALWKGRTIGGRVLP